MTRRDFSSAPAPQTLAPLLPALARGLASQKPGAILRLGVFTHNLLAPARSGCRAPQSGADGFHSAVLEHQLRRRPVSTRWTPDWSAASKITAAFEKAQVPHGQRWPPTNTSSIRDQARRQHGEQRMRSSAERIGSASAVPSCAPETGNAERRNTEWGRRRLTNYNRRRYAKCRRHPRRLWPNTPRLPAPRWPSNPTGAMSSTPPRAPRSSSRRRVPGAPSSSWTPATTTTIRPAEHGADAARHLPPA